MENAADDFAAIAARLREIAADRDEAQMQRADEPAGLTEDDAKAAIGRANAAWDEYRRRPDRVKDSGWLG